MSASLRLWLGASVLLAAVLLSGCGPAPNQRADKTVEVEVTTPISDEVLDYQDFTGRLAAYYTVEMRARASGYIKTAPFKEGDPVHKDDVLFTVDSRLYKADFDQAEANLQLAIADRTLQDATATRARQMFLTRSIGREEYDQSIAAREKSKATVKAMEAARERAGVNLGYTKVYSPINGRISRRNVDPGNLVKADDTMLTTIVEDDRVYAYFDVDERTYLDLVGEKPAVKTASPSPSTASSKPASSRSPSADKPNARLEQLKLAVLMRLANSEEFTHRGKVDFVDNQVNANTGTIRMRGVFANPISTLKSGLFVRIRLPIGKSYPAMLIPDEALQSDQGSKFVYVVDQDNKVQYRRITFGQAIAGLRVIKEGLQLGERVVVTGMQRVRSGLQVRVKEKKPPTPPKNSFRKLLAPEQAEEKEDNPQPLQGAALTLPNRPGPGAATPKQSQRISKR